MPINIDALEVELLCHPDRRFVYNLISGLRHGFFTSITNPPTQTFEAYLQLLLTHDPVRKLLQTSRPL
jgi:hypothetical protein